MQAAEIKQFLYDMGADLCGIASAGRFGGAPEGFRPRDIFPPCRSVVVIAKKIPAGTLRCKTAVPYTVARNILSAELDVLSVRFCAEMETRGVAAVPTGTISPTRFDEKTGRWRGAVSAKHSAVAAGLGRIGKNTLLITPEYGNMVWLNVILTDAELEPDGMLTGSPCEDDCSLCVDNCPAGALGESAMDQNACFAHAFRTGANEEFTIKCHICRSVCPHCLGSKNGGRTL